MNNAGYGYVSLLPEAKSSELRKTFETNVLGATYMVQAVIPHMPSGGRIINISSTASRLGIDVLSAYGASKAAIDSLTYSWALEVSSFKLRT